MGIILKSGAHKITVEGKSSTLGAIKEGYYGNPLSEQQQINDSGENNLKEGQESSNKEMASGKSTRRQQRIGKSMKGKMTKK